MTQEPADVTPTVLVHTSPQPQQTPPPWLAPAVLLLQVARDSGLLRSLQQSVRVPRGRMGTFEVCDFVLVLLLYAVSGEATLLALYASMGPCVSLLAALWSRHHLPARSTLSRFLKAVTPLAADALRELLLVDLLTRGLSGERLGGLWDRAGVRHVLFDVDGTRQAARQRQVVHDDQHPPARRRLGELCIPGYTGRKRGEGVRTRTTVQQAHTREWLGTFGAAGNGDVYADLDRSCQTIARYLAARGLSRAQGVVRLDGLTGYVRGAQVVQQQGLGYIMRVADYSLLQDEPVCRALQQPPVSQFVQPETGTVREVFDLTALDWVGGPNHTLLLRCRLIVTRCRADKGCAVAVGKRQGDFIWELFATDRDPAGLSANDVLSLYFARGGFEQTLAEEDIEQDPDRWCSGHGPGQESWQLLSQWVWNVRLRLGVAAQDPPVRRTLWAEAQPASDSAGLAEQPAPVSPAPCAPADPGGAPTPSAVQDRAAASNPSPGPCASAPQQDCATAPNPSPGPCASAPDQDGATTPHPSPTVPPPAPDAPTPHPGQVAAAAGRGCGKFAGPDFIWTQEQQLRCPAGSVLSPRERGLFKGHLRIRYQARAADCAPCALAPACRGTGASLQRGRRVTVWVDPINPCEPTSAGDSAKPSSAPAVEPLPSPCAGAQTDSPTAAPTSPSVDQAPPRPSLGPEPVWWDDLPATGLRRFCRLRVSCQHVDVPVAPDQVPAPVAVPWTRARRAHRRLSWEQRLARNAHPRRVLPWQIRLFGIPPGIAAYLAGLGLPVP